MAISIKNGYTTTIIENMNIGIKSYLSSLMLLTQNLINKLDDFAIDFGVSLK